MGRLGRDKDPKDPLKLARSDAEEQYLRDCMEGCLFGDVTEPEDLDSASAALKALRKYARQAGAEPVLVERRARASARLPEGDTLLRSTGQAWGYALCAIANADSSVTEYREKHLHGRLLPVEKIPAFLQEHHAARGGDLLRSAPRVQYDGVMYMGSGAISDLAPIVQDLNLCFAWTEDEPHAVRLVLSGKPSDYFPALMPSVEFVGARLLLEVPAYYDGEQVKRILDMVHLMRGSKRRGLRFGKGKAAALGFTVPRRMAGMAWKPIAAEWGAAKLREEHGIGGASLSAIYSEVLRAVGQAMNPPGVEVAPERVIRG